MERIEGVAVGRCSSSSNLQPLMMNYRQNGIQRTWNFMKTQDSVALLLYNATRRSLVLVKQFRPAVYMSELDRLFPGFLTSVDSRPRAPPGVLSGSAGVTYELCGGVMDQPRLTPAELACKEAWEECGYLLSPPELLLVATYKGGVRLTGSSQTMFYAEVTDAKKGGPGGSQAEEGESIEVVHLPLREAKAFSDNRNIAKTLDVIFGISWFLQTVGPVVDLH